LANLQQENRAKRQFNADLEKNVKDEKKQLFKIKANKKEGSMKRIRKSLKALSKKT